MKVFSSTLLLAVASKALADPFVYGGLPYAGHLGYAGLPYAGHLGYAGLPYAHAVVPATQEVTYKTYTPTVETNVVATNLPVPVAVGGYKAVAGDNGDLKGAVHEIPALFGAPALNTQVNEASQGSLTVGTSAVVTHTVGEPIVNEHTVQVPTFGHYYGKRSAEAVVSPLVYNGYPYAGLGHLGYAGLPYAGLPYAGHLGYAGLPYAAHAVVPATQEVTYKTYTPTVETNVVATNLPVPVAVGGYKAVAGDNGDLKGAVHEIPALFGAPALNTQVNEASQGSLTVGTSAVVTHTLGEPIVNEHTVQVPTFGHYYGKRSAEAEAEAVVSPLVYNGYPYAGLGHLGYAGLPYAGLPYAGHLGYAGLPYAGHLGYVGLPYAHAVLPATQEVTYKTYTPTVETNVVATNLPVPVAVGGYKAVAGDNGDLKGAVHEIPALFGAPALNTQVNEASQGSLTVGTSAVVTHTVGEPIVNEHTVQVPTFGHYYGKRSAEAEADPYYAYGAYGHHGGYYGHGYGHGYGHSLHGYGHGYGYGYYG